MEIFKIKTVILFACFWVFTVDCVPVKSSVHLVDKDEKHFPIDEGKHFANLLAEAKDLSVAEPSSYHQDRFRRRVSDYAGKNKMLIPDDIYLPYALRKSYENKNPLENYYDGLRSEDDDETWNSIGEGEKFDDGMWMNSFTRPHYELANMKKPNLLENMMKRFKARQTAENYFY